MTGNAHMTHLLRFDEALAIGGALHDRLVAMGVMPPMVRDDLGWGDVVQFVQRRAAEIVTARAGAQALAVRAADENQPHSRGAGWGHVGVPTGKASEATRADLSAGKANEESYVGLPTGNSSTTAAPARADGYASE